MMALATDPIWTAISEFGTPWPPFRWGSGVGTRNVRRRVAEAFVLIDAKTKLKPLDTPFNSEVKASLKGLPLKSRQKIADAFIGDVEIDGDDIRLLPPEKYDASRKGRRLLQKLIPPKLEMFIEQPVPAGNAKLADKLVIPLKEAAFAPFVAREIRKAITTASSVHDVRGMMAAMDPIEIFIRRNLDNYGGEFIKGNPPFIVINPDAHHIPMAVWHELAHALDHLSLQGKGKRGYASQGQRSLLKVMAAIRDSRAVASLADRAKKDGDIYWIKDQEMFARAYAQFIALETKDASAKKHLQKILNGDYDDQEIWKETQWDEDAFQPIYEAMRELFTSTSTLSAR